MLESRDSSVGIATGYGLDDRELGGSSPGGGKNFLFSTSSRQDHSPPTSAEVKKMWIYTFTPHTRSWRSAYLSTGTTLPFYTHVEYKSRKEKVLGLFD
jgi:hypothetical protein